MPDPFKFCPHCTTKLETVDVYGRLRPQCPACGWIHFLDPKVGVGVLVEQGGTVLLVQRKVNPAAGAWCFPSGFMEADEAPEVAAVRECQEETGLVVETIGPPTVHYYNHDFRGAGIMLFYQAVIRGGELCPGDDADDARFFTVADLPPDEQIAFRSNREILATWRSENLTATAPVECFGNGDLTATMSTAPEKAFYNELHEKLKAFNTTVSPHHKAIRQPGSSQPLNIWLRNPSGNLLGGLTANTFWGWLQIDDLWLAETLRGQGLGARLLHLAEAEARQRGCTRAKLETFSFQARGFYEKQGYTVVGALEDFPPGEAMYWLQKSL